MNPLWLRGKRERGIHWRTSINRHSFPVLSVQNVTVNGCVVFPPLLPGECQASSHPGPPACLLWVQKLLLATTKVEEEEEEEETGKFMGGVGRGGSGGRMRTHVHTNTQAVHFFPRLPS